MICCSAVLLWQLAIFKYSLKCLYSADFLPKFGDELNRTEFSPDPCLCLRWPVSVTSSQGMTWSDPWTIFTTKIVSKRWKDMNYHQGLHSPHWAFFWFIWDLNQKNVKRSRVDSQVVIEIYCWSSALKFCFWAKISKWNLTLRKNCNQEFYSLNIWVLNSVLKYTKTFLWWRTSKDNISHSKLRNSAFHTCF